MTTIEWTDATWNPTRGCSRISPGCVHCYAERMAIRLSGRGRPYEGLVRSGPQGVRWTGKVVLDRQALEAPLHWKTPRRVFVNSMSDLFHESLSDEQIADVFNIMAQTPQHTYQVLTKRSERMRNWFERVPGGSPRRPWLSPHIWIGVSVESDDYVSRLLNLLEVPAAVRFASLEPLLSEPRQLLEWLPRLDWVIVGGESGPGARPFRVEWADAVRRTCAEYRVPFFCKQLGARPERRPLSPTGDSPLIPMGLKDRKGGDPDEWPPSLRVRQFPPTERTP